MGLREILQGMGEWVASFTQFREKEPYTRFYVKIF